MIPGKYWGPERALNVNIEIHRKNKIKRKTMGPLISNLNLTFQELKTQI